MAQKIYQVDAFTNKIFSGNPAAVCPLEDWLSDELMQKIAMENNLAETAFYVKNDEQYYIRWFTPAVEVDLCGHATLASAYVLFNFGNVNEETIRFFSPRSGSLTVTRNDKMLTLNFPSDEYREVEITREIRECFDRRPSEAYKGKTDYLLIFDAEEDILAIHPDLSAIAGLVARGVIISAPGKDVDFVSRFFAPQSGVNEDPVTGSAHTTLIPYWARRLNKTELSAIQRSARTGYLQCHYLNNRVGISGQAKLYLQGEIYID